MTLGEKIYALRKNSGLSQEQLAEILNVSRQSISKWEGNVTYPEPDKLIALSEYFQVSLDYLMKADVTEERFKEEDAPECVTEVVGAEMKQSEKQSGKLIYPPNILIGGRYDEKKQTKQIEESACGFPQCDPCTGDSVFYRNRVYAPRRCVYR